MRLRLLPWVWERLELLHDWDLRGEAQSRRECFARRRILAVTLALLIIDRPRVGAYSCSLKVLDGASHVNPPPPDYGSDHTGSYRSSFSPTLS